MSRKSGKSRTDSIFPNDWRVASPPTVPTGRVETAAPAGARPLVAFPLVGVAPVFLLKMTPGLGTADGGRRAGTRRSGRISRRTPAGAGAAIAPGASDGQRADMCGVPPPEGRANGPANARRPARLGTLVPRAGGPVPAPYGAPAGALLQLDR